MGNLSDQTMEEILNEVKFSFTFMLLANYTPDHVSFCYTLCPEKIEHEAT